MILRDYQTAAIDRVRASLRAGHRRVVLVAPTGAGKTVIAGEILRSAVSKGSRVLYLAHRKELLDQPSRLLDQLGIPHGIIRAADRRACPGAPIQIASVQTLVRREPPPASLVIVDECHRARATTYEALLARYPDARVLGLTATPWRLDGRGLGQAFDDLVVATTPAELVALGYLVQPRVFAPSAPPDRASMRIRQGDFTAEALEQYRTTLLVGDVVKHWSNLAAGMRTVAFAVDRNHSREIRDAFLAAGITAEHVDGSMPEKEREGILARLRSGETTVLTNCSIVSEGFDLPELACCILARPTASSSMYLQQVGRIMRPVEGKTDAVVLDHAGNTLAHGFATDPREYNLGDADRPAAREPAVVICDSCAAAIPRGSNPCPECGADRTIERREVESVGGDLREIESTGERRIPCESCGTPNVAKPVSAASVRAYCSSCDRATFGPATDRASMALKRQEYQRLAEIADRRGYARGWVAHRYRDVFGCWPRGVT